MLENKGKTITAEQEQKARAIAAIAREIPEREQEKILYMMKGIAIMSSQTERKAVGV